MPVPGFKSKLCLRSFSRPTQPWPLLRPKKGLRADGFHFLTWPDCGMRGSRSHTIIGPRPRKRPRASGGSSIHSSPKLFSLKNKSATVDCTYTAWGTIMFQGLWYRWKLNDNVIPFQGVYIIESDGKVFHTGQTDNFERRRAEHVRDHIVYSLWHPNPNYLCMAVGDSRFLDGIEAFLGRVLSVSIDKRYPGPPEIPCNLPSDLSASASAPPRSNSHWNWTPEPNAMQSYHSEHLNPYDVLRESMARFGSTPNEMRPYHPEPNDALSLPETRTFDLDRWLAQFRTAP